MFQKQSEMLAFLFSVGIEIVAFRLIFVEFSLPGAPLEPAGLPLFTRVGSQVDFSMIFSCLGGGFEIPLSPLGPPWACLEATLGATLGAECVKKKRKKKLRGHSAFWRRF